MPHYRAIRVHNISAPEEAVVPPVQLFSNKAYRILHHLAEL
jgi:hypothetical protein